MQSLCPPGTDFPSEEWLRLQFLPMDPLASSAVHYSGRLQVKFAVQSMVLRANHEDDHYAAAVFKYQRAMAVDLRHTEALMKPKGRNVASQSSSLSFCRFPPVF